jgi:hypothetical protein
MARMLTALRHHRGQRSHIYTTRRLHCADLLGDQPCLGEAAETEVSTICVYAPTPVIIL